MGLLDIEFESERLLQGVQGCYGTGLEQDRYSR